MTLCYVTNYQSNSIEMRIFLETKSSRLWCDSLKITENEEVQESIYRREQTGNKNKMRTRIFSCLDKLLSGSKKWFIYELGTESLVLPIDNHRSQFQSNTYCFVFIAFSAIKFIFKHVISQRICLRCVWVAAKHGNVEILLHVS